MTNIVALSPSDLNLITASFFLSFFLHLPSEAEGTSFSILQVREGTIKCGGRWESPTGDEWPGRLQLTICRQTRSFANGCGEMEDGRMGGWGGKVRGSPRGGGEGGGEWEWGRRGGLTLSRIISHQGEDGGGGGDAATCPAERLIC